MEIQAIKHKNERILRIKKEVKKIEATGINITNRIQNLEKWFSGIEHTIEEIDTLVKEKVRSKKVSDTKHAGNLGHYEKNQT